MKTITSNQAAELVYKLFQKHQWLIKSDQLQESDKQFEQEAIEWLLNLNLANPQPTTPAIKRLVATLLTDFLLKLTMGLMGNFQIDPEQTLEQQAYSIIYTAISQSHRTATKKQ